MTAPQHDGRTRATLAGAAVVERTVRSSDVDGQVEQRLRGERGARR
ncbi:hypothetical protein [Kocuria sp. SL71]|nr:hypothetical protein [Kocuria sp. SL71]MCY1683957.1 hypothetical protein [Kocuria sp. SL71]